MEQRLFTYTDERLWSDERIIARFHQLRHELAERAVFLSESRKREYNRDITHVAFEGLQREQVKKRREEEIAWLEYTYQITEMETA